MALSESNREMAIREIRELIGEPPSKDPLDLTKEVYEEFGYLLDIDSDFYQNSHWMQEGRAIAMTGNGNYLWAVKRIIDACPIDDQRKIDAANAEIEGLWSAFTDRITRHAGEVVDFISETNALVENLLDDLESNEYFERFYQAYYDEYVNAEVYRIRQYIFEEMQYYGDHYHNAIDPNAKRMYQLSYEYYRDIYYEETELIRTEVKNSIGDYFYNRDTWAATAESLCSEIKWDYMHLLERINKFPVVPPLLPTVEEYKGKTDFEHWFLDNDKLNIQLALFYGEENDNKSYFLGSDDGDWMRGSAGDEVLIGSGGDDHFIWGSGDGNDIVRAFDERENKNESMILAGLNLDDVKIVLYNTRQQSRLLAPQYSSLILINKQTNEYLVIEDTVRHDGNFNPNSIQNYIFEDQTLTLEELLNGKVYMDDESSLIYMPQGGGTLFANDNGCTIYGGDGVNVVHGGSGNDIIHGNRYNDLILGGGGDDALFGGDGDDSLYGGDGNDILMGNEGDDTLFGGKGNDRLEGGSGNDVYHFGRGDGIDTIIEQDGDSDVLVFGDDIAVSDLRFSKDGNNLVIELVGSSDKIIIDEWYVNSFSHIETFVAGNLSLNSIHVTDLVRKIATLGLPSGVDGSWSSDQLLRLHQINTLYWRSDNGEDPGDIDDPDDEDEDLYLGKNIIRGTDGDDIINGTSLDDALLGGMGNDTLSGNDGDDIIVGGKGDDILDGGAGDDVYVYNLGDGNDTINEAKARYDRGNIIRFGEGISADDLEFAIANPVGNSADIVIRIKSTGETITLKKSFFNPWIDYFKDPYDFKIQFLEFVDGTKISWSEMYNTLMANPEMDVFFPSRLFDGDISSSNDDDNLVGTDGDDWIWGRAGNDILHGNNGNDRLYGEAGDDWLYGGAGNDTLIGGFGDDIFVFGKGDGNDVVNAFDPTIGKNDRILLIGLNQGDVNFIADRNGDFIIQIKDTGETLTVLKGMNNSIYGVQSVEFANGSRLDWEEIAQGVKLGLIPTIVGTGGNDSLSGTAGDDVIFGGDGDDTLRGYDGDDIIHGGRGDDYLIGDGGSDTYLFNRGDGHDYIQDDFGQTGDRNVIRLGEGIGVDDIELLIRHSGAGLARSADFFIKIKDTGETIGVRCGHTYTTANRDNNGSGIHAIEFADGTVWNWEDIRKQPVHIFGDTLYGGADFEGSWIVGNEFNNNIGGSGFDDILWGGAGDDYISDGGGGNDILWGGAGNDILAGNNGDDVYLFGRGDGHDTVYDYGSSPDEYDVVRLGEGIGTDDIELLIRQNGAGAAKQADLIIRIKDTGETLTVYCGVSYLSGVVKPIEAIEFADGTVWNWSDILQQPLHMYDGATYVGGSGDGSIVIGNELDNTISGSDHRDELYGGRGNDNLHGKGGDDLLFGGEGNDVLQGGAGNDILNGGAGNDDLHGDSGDDIYVYNRGDGNDRIFESETRADRYNVIRLGGGITSDDVELLFNSSDLILRIKDTMETITVVGGYSTRYTGVTNSGSIQAIEFDDGTVWRWADILRQPVYMVDALVSVSTPPEGAWLVGNDANNSIIGSSADDILYGGAGDDTIQGGAGNDILYGGTGNDTLTGGGGSDIYMFGRGDGHDVVNEYDGGDRRNVVRLGPDICADDIELLMQQSSNRYMNLIIRIKDTGETLTIASGIYGGVANLTNYSSIQAIEFEDGTVWEWADVCNQPIHLLEKTTTGMNYAYGHDMGSTIVGTDYADTITGYNNGDTLYGGAGDDILYGGAGADTLHGGAGNDILYGQADDDTYLFGRGDGHDAINESENRAGKRNVIRLLEGLGPDDIELLAKVSSGSYLNLIIRIKDTGETLTVSNGIFGGQTNSGNSYSIQAIEFADGTVWEWSDILGMPIQLLESTTTGTNNFTADRDGSYFVGTDYNDTINGRAGNDILAGGKGNDNLNGGEGDDVYLFGRGDGHDVVTESETRVERRNIVRLSEGIGTEDIELLVISNSYSYHDLVIRIKDTEETLTVKMAIWGGKDNTSNSYSIQAIEFADGTVWEWSDILRKPLQLVETTTTGYNNFGGDLGGNNILGTDYNDTLNGYGGDDIFDGGLGNDTIRGAAGDDILRGGAGNDTLYGGTGNDILEGGTGNDVLNGEAGDDVYLFNRGDGMDTINESAGNDTLLFGDGLDITDLWFKRDGGLVITVLGTEDKVTITNWFAGSNYRVETFSAGGMELVNTQVDQLIQALASFGAPQGVNGQWTDEQKENLAPILSGYWRPTGS